MQLEEFQLVAPTAQRRIFAMHPMILQPVLNQEKPKYGIRLLCGLWLLCHCHIEFVKDRVGATLWMTIPLDMDTVHKLGLKPGEIA